MLYTRYRPSLLTQRYLQELEQVRAELDRSAQLPEGFSGELRRHALIDTVHYSTMIEGNTLSLEQVRTVLAGGAVRAPREQVQEVENYREAVSYVQSLVISGDISITEDRVRTLHYLISKSLPSDYAPGRYRTEQNYVIDRTTGRTIFTPPRHEGIAALMREFMDWVNSRQDYPPAIKAALAHLNLVAVHPFLDGNGRTARVLDSLVMYSGGFRAQDLVSVEAYFGRDNRGYYEALSSTLGPHYSPPRDVTTWVEYHLHAHVEQARESVRLATEVKAGLDALWDEFAAEGLSARHVNALWLACYDGDVTNRIYRDIAGRSAQSAAADLSKLVQAGLLERRGRGRGVAYFPTQRVRAIFDGVRAAL